MLLLLQQQPARVLVAQEGRLLPLLHQQALLLQLLRQVLPLLALLPLLKAAHQVGHVGYEPADAGLVDLLHLRRREERRLRRRPAAGHGRRCRGQRPPHRVGRERVDAAARDDGLVEAVQVHDGVVQPAQGAAPPLQVDEAFWGGGREGARGGGGVWWEGARGGEGG